MPDFYRKIISLTFLITLAIASYGEDYLFSIEHISIEQGLPHRIINQVRQDKAGYIWISTLQGLSRYDGYEIKNYDAEFLGTSGDVPLKFNLDKNGYVWYYEKSDVDTIKLKILNPTIDTIYALDEFVNGNLPFKPHKFKRQYSFEGIDEFYFYTSQGEIYRYDDSFEKIYEHPTPVEGDLYLLPDDNEEYWVSYQDTLLKVKEQKVLQKIKSKGHILWMWFSRGGYPIIIEDNPKERGCKRIWELEKNSLDQYTFTKEPISTCDHYIPTVMDEEGFRWSIEGRYLVGTDFNNKEVFRKLTNSFSKSDGHVSTLDLFIDRQNILWLSTDKGVFKVLKQKNHFRTLLKNHSIRGIIKIGSDICVNSYSGYKKISLKTKEVKTILSEDYFGMGILRDKKGMIWVGTDQNFLFRYSPKTKKVVSYSAERDVQLMLPFQNRTTNKIWVAGSKGLFFLDEKNKVVKPYTKDKRLEGVYIRHTYQNEQGIWLVTNEGLFLMNSRTELIIKCIDKSKGLPNQNLNYLYEDKEGIFWIASKGGGLIRWDRTNNEFKQFTQTDGLSNNVIYAIYEDEDEYLWLPSNYGLMRFHKSTKIINLYLPRDGIPHEEFSTYAHYKDEKGFLYFGGINGLTCFHPQNFIQEEEWMTPLQITSLSVLEGSATAMTDKTEDVLLNSVIELVSSDKLFELHFALMDFANPKLNRYAYRIEGYQDNWTYINENFIRINNLPYGEYQLRIKGQGQGGVWSNNELSVTIDVCKPFYLKWWFWSIIFIGIVIDIALFVAWRLRKLKKDKAFLESEVDKRTATIQKQAEELQELDKLKTQFFSNITHEFRTPLTLIIGPTEQMIAHEKETIFKKQLGGVLQNARHLLELINQLLDISKLENKGMKVKASHGDVVEYVKNLVDQFQPLAKQKGQKLIFLTSLDRWKTNFDKEKLHKIIFNLLSNALKFTPEGGVVQCCLIQATYEGKQCIELHVKDSGLGIDKHKINHIFDRFYQAENTLIRNNEGTGIGLALVKELVELQEGRIRVKSQKNEGTSFKVILPVLASKEDNLVNLDTKISLQDSNLPIVELESQPDLILNQIAINESNPSKLRLLIIEDNPEMRMYIRSCIARDEYTIIEASNGKEGLELALQYVPDLIISDVMMPLKNGFEVSKSLRENIQTSHIPLILLTAKTSLDSRLEGLEKGADAYLTKPFSRQELEIRIRKLIELRKLLQERYQDILIAPAPKKGNPVLKKEDEFIEKIKQIIKNNIDKKSLNGDFIGKEIGMSRMQLHRKIKALTNESISEIIREMRLQKACVLLNEGTLNISEIAYQVGFNSPNYFSKAFRKRFGIAPSSISKK